MAKRKIIRIDEQKCTGCGDCIPNCPEGALQMIDGKARLISDLFCDGLGACIGHCPEGAITTEEREAESYDERRVMANIVKQGKNVIKAHLEHLKEHNQHDYLKDAMAFLKENNIEAGIDEGCFHSEHAHTAAGSGCPGSRIMDLGLREADSGGRTAASEVLSQLRQWPIQIMLAPVLAPFFKDADLLIAADCVPFAYPDFHNDLLRGRVVLVGCPKLDDIEVYRDKIARIVKENDIRSITNAHMEVPCCFGLMDIIKSAIASSGRDIPYKDITVSIKGEIKNT